jgi:hypothetical protein
MLRKPCDLLEQRLKLLRIKANAARMQAAALASTDVAAQSPVQHEAPVCAEAPAVAPAAVEEVCAQTMASLIRLPEACHP